MAFKGIHNQNPFIVPAIFFALLIFARNLLTDRSRLRYWIAYCCKPFPTLQETINQSINQSVHSTVNPSLLRRFLVNRSIHQLIIGLFLVAFVGVPVFEAYFNVYECSVSNKYYDQTINLAVDQMNCFDRFAIEHWLDYATLLNQMRGQTINHWDHDADFSIIHPDYSIDSANPTDQSVNPSKWILSPLSRAEAGYMPQTDDVNSPAINRLINQLEQCGLVVSYDRTRHLIQTINKSINKKGPHTDIWLWIPTTDPAKQSVQLYTADHTVHFYPRPIEYIFPLTNQYLNASNSQVSKQPMWLDRPASIPHKPHHVSSAEFSVYGGSYLLNQVFRGDCFHNFFNLRWMY